MIEVISRPFLCISGGSSFVVYPSQFAGTNKATAAGWELDDIGFSGIDSTPFNQVVEDAGDLCAGGAGGAGGAAGGAGTASGGVGGALAGTGGSVALGGGTGSAGEAAGGADTASGPAAL